MKNIIMETYNLSDLNISCSFICSKVTDTYGTAALISRLRLNIINDIFKS